MSGRGKHVAYARRASVRPKVFEWKAQQPDGKQEEGLISLRSARNDGSFTEPLPHVVESGFSVGSGGPNRLILDQK